MKILKKLLMLIVLGSALFVMSPAARAGNDYPACMRACWSACADEYGASCYNFCDNCPFNGASYHFSTVVTCAVGDSSACYGYCDYDKNQCDIDCDLRCS